MQTKRKPLYSGKPGNPIIYSSDDIVVVDKIAREYVKNIAYRRNEINKFLEPIYNRPLNIEESKLTDTLLKIRAIKEETGKDLLQIVEDIRSYLGFKCSFYRSSHGKDIPVDSDRILRAYRAVVEKLPRTEIKKILYL